MAAPMQRQLAGKGDDDNSGSDRKRRLVIFDQDGTILCIHATWTPWIRAFAVRINNATNLDLADKIYDRLGFDNGTGKFLPGVFAEGTNAQCWDTVTQLLRDEGVPPEKAERIMEKNWQYLDMATHGDTKSVGDVASLFRVLKSKGYLIAVNTSNSRHIAEHAIEHLKLTPYVDMLVCGDDEDTLPKPHPRSAEKICDKLQVDPSDAIMIGDSKTDMKFGHNSGFPLIIGVLTGVAQREVLEQDATYVVDDIHHALELIVKS